MLTNMYIDATEYTTYFWNLHKIILETTEKVRKIIICVNHASKAKSLRLLRSTLLKCYRCDVSIEG